MQPQRRAQKPLKSDWSTSHTPRYQHWPIRLNFHQLFKNFEKEDELIWTKSQRFSRRKCPWRQKQIRPYLWWRDLLPRLSLKSHPFIKSKSFKTKVFSVHTSYYHNQKPFVFPTQAVFHEPYRCHGITVHSETHGYKAISKKTECWHWVSWTILSYIAILFVL